MENNPPEIHLESELRGGSKIKSLYGERKVRVFPVLEPEFDTISYLNTASMIAFSLGSFFASSAARDKIEWVMFKTEPGIISLAFFIFGVIALGMRIWAVHKIKRQHDGEPQGSN